MGQPPAPRPGQRPGRGSGRALLASAVVAALVAAWRRPTPAGEPLPAFVGAQKGRPEDGPSGVPAAAGRPQRSQVARAAGAADYVSEVIESAHAAWAGDEYVRAAQLYVKVLEAADAAGDEPGQLDATEHLQCHANLGSSYMMLAAERGPAGAKPDVQRRATLLAASLQHWRVAERVGPGSPLLSYFLSSVSRDLGLAAEAVRLEQEMDSASAPEGPVVEPIERRDASELTYAEFVERYVQTGTPVVITGAPVPRWDLDFLEERFGDREVPRLQHRPDNAGEDWGALEAAERTTLREHIQGLRRAAAGDGSSAPMLFDHALADLAPELLEELVVPKYFAVDYLRAIPREERAGIWPNPQRFPSLFVQPPGTRCGLHVDQAGTHFYQMLLSGKKRWRVFRPEDTPRLYPRGNGLLFEADAFQPDLERFPLLGTARVQEAVLAPGEAIFVPQGSAHQVQNEEVSVAMSANYLAGVGLDNALAELELLSQGGARPEYAQTMEALRKWAPEPGSPPPEDPGDLPFRDFDAAVWQASGAAR